MDGRCTTVCVFIDLHTSIACTRDSDYRLPCSLSDNFRALGHLHNMNVADRETIIVDLAMPAESEIAVAKFTAVDLKDYGQVVASLQECDDRYRGIDAVIHLAAIPAPGKAVSTVSISTFILISRPLYFRTASEYPLSADIIQC